MHARSQGAIAVKANSLAELEAALVEAKSAPRTTVIVIDTDPMMSTDAGGHWWEVAVPEISRRHQHRDLAMGRQPAPGVSARP